MDRTVLLADAAIATSGDTYRFVLVEGVRYSHVVDPRTGLGVTSPRIVTVVAPTAAEADAVASALSVVGSAGGSAILAGRRDVVGRVVERLAQEREVVFGCDRPPRFARHFCTEAVDDTAHAYSKHRH